MQPGQMGQGIHSIEDAAYHADPAPSPSLSRSLAKLLIDTSPAHVFANCSRLNGSVYRRTRASDEAEIGSAVHALFLKGQDEISVINFPTYQTKEAKALRDAALLDGKIPLKQHDYESVLRIVDALERFRARTGAFTKGAPEQTLLWQEEGGHYARAKPDWLPDDAGAPMWDLKTTDGTATAQAWTRAGFDKGCDYQEAHYTRGAEMLRGEPPDGMLFCIVEQNPPYGIRVFQLSAEARDIGQEKIAEARELWGACLSSGVWPGYPDEIVQIDAPGYLRYAWENRMALKRMAADAASLRETATARLIGAGSFGG